MIWLLVLRIVKSGKLIRVELYTLMNRLKCKLQVVRCGKCSWVQGMGTVQLLSVSYCI